MRSRRRGPSFASIMPSITWFLPAGCMHPPMTRPHSLPLARLLQAEHGVHLAAQRRRHPHCLCHLQPRRRGGSLRGGCGAAGAPPAAAPAAATCGCGCCGRCTSAHARRQPGACCPGGELGGMGGSLALAAWHLILWLGGRLAPNGQMVTALCSCRRHAGRRLPQARPSGLSRCQHPSRRVPPPC